MMRVSDFCNVGVVQNSGPVEIGIVVARVGFSRDEDCFPLVMEERDLRDEAFNVL